MKKTAALIVLVLLMLLALPATAGIEPSPFAPQIGKLTSIANSLSSVSQRLNAAATRMGVGPSPFHSVENQWEAEANKLDVLQGRLELVAVALEDETLDEGVKEALVKVSDAAQAVMDAADEWAPAGVALPEELRPVRDGADEVLHSVEEILRTNNQS